MTKDEKYISRCLQLAYNGDVYKRQTLTLARLCSTN